MQDIEKLKNNGLHFARRTNNRRILASADGKTHYKEIAEKLGIHPTVVSGTLKEAEKLGLATKDSGFYKKNSGVMQYIPVERSELASKVYNIEFISEKLKKRIMKGSKPILPKYSNISAKIVGSSGKMTAAYQHLYFTENALRELIRKVFQKIPNWWVSALIPNDVKVNVSNTSSKIPYHVSPRNDELEYTHLGDLKKIIVKNWGMFSPYMNEKDKTKFSATIDKALPLRNAIGHCIPLSASDSKWVEMRFQDILLMIK